MNVIVCGDLPEPLAIYLKNPNVSNLKGCIEKRTNIPVRQQALYLGERLLSHNDRLSDIKGMRDQSGSQATGSPYKLCINLYLRVETGIERLRGR